MCTFSVSVLERRLKHSIQSASYRREEHSGFDYMVGVDHEPSKAPMPEAMGWYQYMQLGQFFGMRGIATGGLRHCQRHESFVRHAGCSRAVYCYRLSSVVRTFPLSSNRSDSRKQSAHTDNGRPHEVHSPPPHQFLPDVLLISAQLRRFAPLLRPVTELQQHFIHRWLHIQQCIWYNARHT
jgi:hypothetical protein